jgi:signal transduction histidine kinase
MTGENRIDRMTPGTAARAGPSLPAILVALLAVAVLAGCSGHPVEVTELADARFLASPDPRPPPDDAPWQPQRLPDDWKASRPGAAGFGWYRFSVELPDPAGRDFGFYLTATLSNGQLFVNGVLAGQSGDLEGPPPERWEAAQLLTVPRGLLRAGRNTIDLRIHVPRAAPGGIGPALLGPWQSLYPRSLADQFGHTIGPSVASLTLLALGIFILILWMRIRDDVEYLVFATATILWGLHTAVTLLPRAPLPPPHFAVWWNAVYVLWVVLLCIFCVRFARARWPLYERVVLVFAAACAPVLYAAAAAGVLLPAAAVVRLGALAAAAFALYAVVDNARRSRDTVSALLLATAGVAAAVGVRDWLAAQDPENLRPMYLVPYVALAFFCLVGWIMIDRFAGTLAKYEKLNLELERRVAEKSRALEIEAARQAQARREADDANLAKSRFLAAASHDLRQPLHALGLFASALAQRARDDESRELTGRITRSIGALETLFSEVLDVSRLDAGAIVASARPVALQPLFDRLADDLASAAEEKDLALRLVPTRAVVRSDPVLLERILRNLVANAIRYTDAGGVLVGVRRRAGGVVLEVRDSGIGIPEEHRARIFEEFYQVERPDSDRHQGLGLGLSIVRRLCDLLGHRLALASAPGRGTTFRIGLEEEALPAAGGPGVESSLPDGPLAGARILVIEDDRDVRDSMVAILRAWGCDVSAAASADEAARMGPGTRAPSALVVDYRLGPGATGVEVARSLHRDWGAPVPTLIISGESSEGELARILESGFPLLRKPVPPARLRSLLAHLLAGPSP